jgi:hypothetical protein
MINAMELDNRQHSPSKLIRIDFERLLTSRRVNEQDRVN